MAGPPAPPRGGMSLYANLLDPKADATTSISRAPVLFSQSDEAKDDAATKKPVDPGAPLAIHLSAFPMLTVFS